MSGQTQLKEALVQTKTSSSKEALERQDTNKTKAFELKQDIGTMLYDGKKTYRWNTDCNQTLKEHQK